MYTVGTQTTGKNFTRKFIKFEDITELSNYALSCSNSRRNANETIFNCINLIAEGIRAISHRSNSSARSKRAKKWQVKVESYAKKSDKKLLLWEFTCNCQSFSTTSLYIFKWRRKKKVYCVSNIGTHSITHSLMTLKQFTQCVLSYIHNRFCLYFSPKNICMMMTFNYKLISWMKQVTKKSQKIYITVKTICLSKLPQIFSDN